MLLIIMDIVRSLSGIPYLQKKIAMDAIILGRDDRGWRAVHDEITTLGKPVVPGGCSGLFLRRTQGGGIIPDGMRYHAITRTNSFFSEGRQIYNWTRRRRAYGDIVMWTYGQPFAHYDIDRSMT